MPNRPELHPVVDRLIITEISLLYTITLLRRMAGWQREAACLFNHTREIQSIRREIQQRQPGASNE